MRIVRSVRALLLAMALPGLASAADLRLSSDPIPGQPDQYIVVLDADKVRLGASNSMLPTAGTMAIDMVARYGGTFVRDFTHVLPGYVIRANAGQIRALLGDARVAYVEQDGVVRASVTQSGATWGIDRVDQRDLPLSTTYVYDTTASNVNAYIIDTGVLGTHTEFTGRMVGGFTVISDGNGTTDCNGHGTHVAGTVAGTTYGVAKAARISPIRVLSCNGFGAWSGVISGMDWVAANHVKPAVANMSLGGGASTATDDAIARMSSAGVTVVVAAGNENQDACNVSPARAPSAITVGSTTSTDARSSFSNWGTCLDIFAPGSSILSAWHTGTSATNTISGTSMASPHVAGVAALYLADNPTATPAQVATAVLNASTINKVTSPGTNSPNRLVYSLLSTPLTRGVTVSDLSTSTGNSLHYAMQVPAGFTRLYFRISGGTGNADLYVRFGSAPTDTVFDCRPLRSDNDEICRFPAPQAGTYHVRLKASSSFSGVSLVGDYAQTYSNTADYPIADYSRVESPIAVSGRNGNAWSNTWVDVDIKHARIGDLRVALLAPDGSVYVLHDRTGGTTQNINTRYIVDLSSEALNGTWKLRVNDNATGATGFIDSWSLNF